MEEALMGVAMVAGLFLIGFFVEVMNLLSEIKFGTSDHQSYAVTRAIYRLLWLATGLAVFVNYWNAVPIGLGLLVGAHVTSLATVGMVDEDEEQA